MTHTNGHIVYIILQSLEKCFKLFGTKIPFYPLVTVTFGKIDFFHILDFFFW